MKKTDWLIILLLIITVHILSVLRDDEIVSASREIVSAVSDVIKIIHDERITP